MKLTILPVLSTLFVGLAGFSVAVPIDNSETPGYNVGLLKLPQPSGDRFSARNKMYFFPLSFDTAKRYENEIPFHFAEDYHMQQKATAFLSTKGRQIWKEEKIPSNEWNVSIFLCFESAQAAERNRLYPEDWMCLLHANVRYNDDFKQKNQVQHRKDTVWIPLSIIKTLALDIKVKCIPPKMS
ncbi:hypothetical protein J3R30DRAFT_3400332 [Lentinula aciculospora]|uniref:Uncharacterized protein n=1 Tax=Lentinula aciculospora TaxID=153920 RepID=A0A9W9AAT6_9AGAR|nr:hypothetical protein J3R30DRAFT_3404522 [Lentinula aciculospora]KAJ4487616.1 hypothetical protein J3R30DRAFT_3400332 [Lentinula aciculospora]